MEQSDIRMGWAPALLCIEDEPAKLKKPPISFGYRGRTNDPFEVGNHKVVVIDSKFSPNVKVATHITEADCVQGKRAERFAAEQNCTSGYPLGVDFADITTPLGEYVFKFSKANKNDLLTLQHVYAEMVRAVVDQMRLGTGIFRGANDNKTATEVQLRAASAELRIQDALVNKARVQEKLQRHVEYATMPRRSGKTITQRLLEQKTGGQNGWFVGEPPDIGWWQASKSKREDHYRHWNGWSWSRSATSLDGNCSDLNPCLDSPANSAKVKWRPVTPPWASRLTLLLNKGRPIVYRPTEEDPLAQLRLHESFNSSSISGYLSALTKQKVFEAQKRVEAMMRSDPQGGVIGAALGSAPWAPELAEVNAALSRLSGAAQGSSCAAQQASSAEAGEERSRLSSAPGWPRWMSGDWDNK